jgi:hypothetical protein
MRQTGAGGLVDFLGFIAPRARRAGGRAATKGDHDMARAALGWACLTAAGFSAVAAADPPKAGDPAPEIMALHPDGNGVPFPDGLKGKVVLVVFWELDATGTGGMPFAPLRELRAEHAKDDRFLILTVCVGAGRWDQWSALIGRQGTVDHQGRRVRFLDDPKWWNAIEVGRDPARRAHKRFGATALPAYYLIGADGRLASAGVPEKDLGAGVKRALR